MVSSPTRWRLAGASFITAIADTRQFISSALRQTSATPRAVETGREQSIREHLGRTANRSAGPTRNEVPGRTGCRFARLCSLPACLACLDSNSLLARLRPSPAVLRSVAVVPLSTVHSYPTVSASLTSDCLPTDVCLVLAMCGSPRLAGSLSIPSPCHSPHAAACPTDPLTERPLHHRAGAASPSADGGQPYLDLCALHARLRSHYGRAARRTHGPRPRVAEEQHQDSQLAMTAQRAAISVAALRLVASTHAVHFLSAAAWLDVA